MLERLVCWYTCHITDFDLQGRLSKAFHYMSFWFADKQQNKQLFNSASLMQGQAEITVLALSLSVKVYAENNRDPLRDNHTTTCYDWSCNVEDIPTIIGQVLL